VKRHFIQAEMFKLFGQASQGCSDFFLHFNLAVKSSFSLYFGSLISECFINFHLKKKPKCSASSLDCWRVIATG
ncbi:MAG: hypothetical protein FWF59_03565, partial [Turicibacter sp.]|nr:hypothetical protein [Turicibacter sp.]